MSIAAINGGNFSGRTGFLQNEVRGHGQGTYVGPAVYNYISALAPDVASEIRLHQRAGENAARRTNELVENLGLLECGARNPFRLSGGQQACLALTAAAAMGREVAAADSCLEQLDSRHRGVFLHWAAQSPTRWFVADNRLDEFHAAHDWVQRIDLRSAPQLRAPGRLRPLRLAPDAISGRKASSLAFHKLTFEYVPGRPVLNRLSWSLPPALYLLDGPNGAGKSTVAKVAAGVLRPTAGHITVAGRSVAPWRCPGQLVGYHFQNPDVQLFTSTVKQEILEGSGTLTHRRFDSIVHMFGLEDVLDCHPLDLPFVGRKRVALAATIAMPAPWLILDEPTLGQDSETLMVLVALVRALVAAGRGVVVISHSRSLRSLLAADIIGLRNGDGVVGNVQSN